MKNRLNYLVIAVLAPLACLTAQEAATPSTSALLETARQHRESGDEAAAHTSYESAIKQAERLGEDDLLYDGLFELAILETAGGDYKAGLERALEAVLVAQKLGSGELEARAVNRAGAAELYAGNYSEALVFFNQALEIDRRLGDTEGIVLRLNNIGNVHFFEGRYFESLGSYNEALELLSAAQNEPWRERWQYVTIVNTATVYQRLGQYEKALDLYTPLREDPAALSPREQALLQSNLGALYRHMGDSPKALDAYRAARLLFQQERDLDGELGVVKNSGIALALDLNDYTAALEAFELVIQMAGRAGNGRQLMQARLYRGIVLLELGEMDRAKLEFEAVLEAAESMETPEERWKALHSLARIADARGDRENAARQLESAVETIEALRSGLTLSSLRSRFFLDKRDVYDALIEHKLTTPRPTGAEQELLHWIERSRARTFQDQMLRNSKFLGADISPPEDSMTGGEIRLAEIQQRLDPATAILVFWTSRHAGATLWITKSASGVRRFDWNPRMDAQVRRFVGRLGRPSSDDWRTEATALGERILGELPVLDDPRIRNLGIVPDGALQLLPFEILNAGHVAAPMLERFGVFYLTSANLVPGEEQKPGKRFMAPWSRSLVALAASQTGRITSDSPDRAVAPLPGAEEEVGRIASLLPGSAELKIGPAATRDAVLNTSFDGVPLLHFAVHAFLDDAYPERSYVALAPGAPGGEASRLFLAEVPTLELSSTRLVTVSACETARGRMIRGEGIQNFSRAFLLAGAGATVTTLWRVSDTPTASFMEQFYFHLSEGLPKAEALRRAKLKFLRSGTALADPFYWAPFVITGDALTTVPLPVPWTRMALWLSPLFVLGAGLLIRRGMAGRS